MSENTEKMDSKAIDRLDELLDYVHRVGKLNQKPIFRIEEYKQLNIWEHELKESEYSITSSTMTVFLYG